MELYLAYLHGRADKDPSEFWYKGELGFFDFYIIPLATKLLKCGVLKVSNDELLSYARQNRTEWEVKGKDIVEQMKKKALQTLPPTEIHTKQEKSPGHLGSMTSLDTPTLVAGVAPKKREESDKRKESPSFGMKAAEEETGTEKTIWV